MRDADILREARSLVERGWTQFAPARDVSGRMVEVDDPSAVRWCAYGAVTLATLRSCPGLTLPEVEGAGPEFENLMWFNDDPGTTREAVLSWFNRAILEVGGNG